MLRRPISIAEPVTELKHIKIIEQGEPLVDFLENCPSLIMDSPRFRYRRETLVRESVAKMLEQAGQAAISKGYQLAILEGWRPPHIQARMYRGVWNRFKEKHPDWSDVKLRRVVNRFTAPLNAKVPPPHSTGGAVDVFLYKDGQICDHMAPFGPFDQQSFPTDSPGLAQETIEVRRILRECLLPTGLTNYPSEYWHWSYGDQGWAYRGGHPHALYAPIVPPNWEPDPEDLVDEPLVFLDLNPTD